MNDIFTIIVPTHRPEFLNNLINNISEQFTKPDRIIFILDKATEDETEELIKKKKFLFQGLQDTKIYIVKSGLTGALNAFKQCFKQMEQFYDKTKNNYYMIMEDDTKFFGMGSFKYIKNMIRDYGKVYKPPEFTEFSIINIPIIDTNKDGNLDINTLTPNYTLLDTCSIMYKFNESNIQSLQELNKKIKSLPYTMIADLFIYNYFLTRQTRQTELRLSKICIISTIHPNQISNNLNAQIFESSLLWEKEFKIGKSIRKDIWLQHLLSLKCIYTYLMMDMDSYERKPKLEISKSKKLIKEYKKLLELPSDKFLIEVYNFLFENSEIICFLNEFNFDDKDIDINPYLKEKL